MNGMYLYETGGSSETVFLEATDENESGAGTLNVSDAYLQIVELPDSAEWVHADNGATDSLTTALAGTSTWYDLPLSSTQRTDGNSNLSLDSANNAIQNDSGGTASVLLNGWQRWDRDSTSSSNRKMPWARFNNGGTGIGYGYGGAFSRGQQSSADTWQAHFSSAALLDVADGADVTFEVREPANGTNSDMGIYASTSRHFLGVQALDLSTLDAGQTVELNVLGAAETLNQLTVEAAGPDQGIDLIGNDVSFTAPASDNDEHIFATDASFAISGDLDVRAKIVKEANTGVQVIGGNWRFGQTKSWFFQVDADNLELHTSGTGGADSFMNSTATLSSAGISAGDTVYVRATYDVSASESSFYYKTEEGSPWTQLGAAVSGNQTAINTTSTTIYAFQDVAGSVESELFWLEVRNGIDGTLVGKMDAVDSSNNTASWTGSVDGLTWDPNGSNLTRNAGSSGLAAPETLNQHTVDQTTALEVAAFAVAAPETLNQLAVDYTVALSSLAAPETLNQLAVDYLVELNALAAPETLNQAQVSYELVVPDTAVVEAPETLNQLAVDYLVELNALAAPETLFEVSVAAVVSLPILSVAETLNQLTVDYLVELDVLTAAETLQELQVAHVVPLPPVEASSTVHELAVDYLVELSALAAPETLEELQVTYEVTLPDVPTLVAPDGVQELQVDYLVGLGALAAPESLRELQVAHTLALEVLADPETLNQVEVGYVVALDSLAAPESLQELQVAYSVELDVLAAPETLNQLTVDYLVELGAVAALS